MSRLESLAFGVGRTLRDARIQKDFSQDELSSLSGVPQPTITRTERGLQNAKFEDLRALAPHLDLPLDVLMAMAKHERDTRRRTRFAIACISNILEAAVIQMSPVEQIETVSRVGNRIKLFREDSDELAYNVALFLTGKLELDELPKNGLRPLRHYICPITQDIEEWEKNELREATVPYRREKKPEDAVQE